MKLEAEQTINIFILAAATAYTMTTLCCVFVMWTLRKQFYIALRSPLLGCMIGTSYTLRSCTSTYVTLLEWHNWTHDGKIKLTGISACIKVLLAPASLVSVGAMIGWVLRLLVMYDPVKRRKWGRYTNEKRVFRALVLAYVLLEAGAWTLVSNYGMSWVASKLTILDVVSMLSTLTAAVLLASPLRNVRDITQLSSDAQHLGALMVWTIVVFLAAAFVTMSRPVYKYVTVCLAIFVLQPVAWTITIRPIVDYLRGNDVHGSRLALLLPWVWLWRRIVHGGGNSYGRVACAADSKMPTPNRFATTHFHDSPLVAVMEFLPLREAFGEYCRRALCSESFQFLVDVAEFETMMRARGDDKEKSKDEFDEFTAIVNEYVKDNSNSEVNIDSGTKKKILGVCDRSTYSSLDLESREAIFGPAEKEVAKMLAENLLNKFKATAAYKEIIGAMELEAN